MTIRYGFTVGGGFAVVDDSQRCASFAFHTSDHEVAARKNAERVALDMIASTWKECPARIREEHYRISCEELEKAGYKVAQEQ